MPVSLYIPNWHPTSINKLHSSSLHWSKKAKLKKADRVMVATYAQLWRLPKADGKRRVTMTIILAPGKRGCDPDAYWKSALDAMTHAGLILGDSYHQVVLNPVIYERGILDRWGTRIELEGV